MESVTGMTGMRGICASCSTAWPAETTTTDGSQEDRTVVRRKYLRLAGGAMLGPGSATWRHAADWRLLLGSGRALVLQVAHPTVGAGVADHSDFRRRPWQRLRRSVDSLMVQAYGGSRLHDEAKRLRNLHKHFTGVDERGRPYSALDPDAY